MFNSRAFVAELIGTFALVFIGAGAGVVGIGGLVGVALAHGLVIATFVYIYGHISGAHFNPAVTFGLALNRTVKWGQAAYYWVAQFTGAILAAVALNYIAASVTGMNGAGTVGTLTESQPIPAFLAETLLTFFLMNAVLHAAVAGRAGPFAGLVIGLTVTFAIIAGGPMTGASLNPARTFGPAIYTGPSFSEPYTYLIYLAGPFLGCALAVGLFRFLNVETVPVESIKKPAKKK
jgi:MIP family channel proteins